MFSRKRFNLILILIISLATQYSAAGELLLAVNKPYPDVWHRQIEPGYAIYEMFFSDQDIWGDEPVLVLYKPDPNDLNDPNHLEFKAKGFFSGKTVPIKNLEFKPFCDPKNLMQYTYQSSNRKMSRTYFGSQKYCGTRQLLPDSSIILFQIESLLESGILNKIFLDNEQKNRIKNKKQFDGNHNYVELLESFPDEYAVIGENEANCEPINVHLNRVTQDGQLVWSKTYIRFYPDRDHAPDQFNDRCFSKKIRVKNPIQITVDFLILPDQTMLIAFSNLALRVNMTDGSSQAKNTGITIFDTSKVIQAKLGLMREARAKIKLCLANGTKRITNQECQLYTQTATGLEQLQVDLFHKINHSLVNE